MQTKNWLLVCCLEGEVLEVECPEADDFDADDEAKTYHLASLPTRTYKFLSIKSKLLVLYDVYTLEVSTVVELRGEGTGPILSQPIAVYYCHGCRQRICST